MDEENWIIEFTNCIKMDDENIEKFKKLYGVGRRNGRDAFLETLFSLSRIIPEPIKDASDKNWIDNSGQDIDSFKRNTASNEGNISEPVIGRELETWRYDNWGTSSEALYDSCEMPFGLDLWGYVPKENDIPVIRPLDELLKGEYAFYTLRKPPIKIYEKMAADGLVFETTWGSDADDEWAIGKGQVVDGQFQYHIGPMTGSQKMDMISIIYGFMDSGKIPNDIDTIVVENREHLDQLLGISLCLFIDYTIFRNNVLDLNFLDVSNVTDLSNLFANIDVYPCTEDDDTPSSEEGGFCNIRLDISKWNVSNVTKMAHLLDNDRIDLGDLSKWDRSKVTDC
jgi:hypothetical protein